MTKRWLRYAGLLALVGPWMGCARSSRSIFVVPRDTAEAFWVTEHMGAAEAAARYGVHIYWNGPNGENDVQQQIVLADRAIHERAMGLVVSPSSPFALNTVIQRALAKGISVVVLGPAIPVAPAQGLSFVETDMAQTGKLAAERAESIGGKVALLGLDALTPGSTDRAEAFEQAMAAEEKPLPIVERIGGPLILSRLEAEAERMLRRHPDVTVIFALNNVSTRAAAAAVLALGVSDRVRVIGSDQTLDTMYQLRLGQIDSLVIQDMRALGQKAVDNIVAARAGKPVALRTIVAPALLTRKTIDDEAMQQKLMMNWRVGS